MECNVSVLIWLTDKITKSDVCIWSTAATTLGDAWQNQCRFKFPILDLSYFPEVSVFELQRNLLHTPEISPTVPPRPYMYIPTEPNSRLLYILLYITLETPDDQAQSADAAQGIVPLLYFHPGDFIPPRNPSCQAPTSLNSPGRTGSTDIDNLKVVVKPT